MYKRHWLIRFWVNGFEGKMLVYGTEEELWDYLGSEIGNYSYTGATEKEVQAAEVLHLKTYLCPEVKHH